MRLIIAAVLLTLGVGSLAAGTAPEWTGEKRDLDFNSHRGSAAISVDPPSVVVGEIFSVDIRFFNGGAGDDFYNPFFGKTPFPALLAIYNADHKYIGDLWGQSGSTFGLDATDWTFIPGQCYVGRSERFMAGYVPGVAEGLPGAGMLPPGEYYVQMIYFKAFLASNPARRERRRLEDDEKAFRQFEKNFDRAELFRSNVVKVRFTAK